jgi:hypothetical protein
MSTRCPAGQCSQLLYVFKAARNGPLTPPHGRASGPPLALWAGYATRPPAGVTSEKPRAAKRQHEDVAMGRWRAAPVRELVARGLIARALFVGDRRAMQGCGYCACGGGAQAPG